MLRGIGGFEMKLKSSTSISLAFALAILILHSNALSQAPSPQKAADPNPSNVRSKISIYDLESKSIHVIYTADKLWEAPNWSPDGKYLLVNSGGALYRLAIDVNGKAQPQKLALDAAYQCNNDHGITRDGKLLAFSAKFGSAPESQVFVASSDGANPRLLTPNSPSYFHGWSPDGKWLAFVGKRGEYFNIFRVPMGGGAEQRLSSSPVADDGPDYSPDGEYVYFNSDRTGRMQIWRMKPDGSEQEQITSDDYCNWFAHPSPNGRWIVFLSYAKDVTGHPANKDVVIRLMSLPDKKIQVLTKLFGGQGTINVPSWSPDSRNVAFVSYQMVYP